MTIKCSEELENKRHYEAGGGTVARNFLIAFDCYKKH